MQHKAYDSNNDYQTRTANQQAKTRHRRTHAIEHCLRLAAYGAFHDIRAGAAFSAGN